MTPKSWWAEEKCIPSHQRSTSLLHWTFTWILSIFSCTFSRSSQLPEGTELLLWAQLAPRPSLFKGLMALFNGWIIAVQRISSSKHNGPFPSSPLPPFQSYCYENQFSFILKLVLIIMTKISHLDSLWKRDQGKLGNGLLSRPVDSDLSSG